MKLKKILLVCALSFSTTACSTLTEVASNIGLDAPTFTNEQAVSKMEDTIKAHAALDNTTPGPLRTVCNYDGSLTGGEVYHCTTYVKQASVTLYADCTEEQCNATGYDKVEEDK